MNVDQEMDCNRCYVVSARGMLTLSIFNIYISMIPSQSKLNIPERKVKYSSSHMKYILNVVNDIFEGSILEALCQIHLNWLVPCK